MTSFVDRVVLHVQAGNGGHGCASILREKFKPLGGPDGGDGGHGGSVRLVVDPGVHTLLDFHFRAARQGRERQGRRRQQPRRRPTARDLDLRVPDGTVVQTLDGEVLADLVGAGTTLRGGPRRPGRARQRGAGQHPPPGAGLRRAGRAGRAARRRAGAQERGRRRAWSASRRPASRR